MAKKIRGTCPAQWLCGFSLVDPEFLHQRNRERENIQDGTTDATNADILKREKAPKRTIRVEQQMPQTPTPLISTRRIDYRHSTRYFRQNSLWTRL